MNSLNVTQLAEHIGVARRTMYMMLKDGRFAVRPIKGTKPRRWSTAAVDKWLGRK